MSGIDKIEPTEFAFGSKESKSSAYHNDVFFFRMVAAVLGAVAIISLLSIAILSGISYFFSNGQGPWVVPESITALGSAAVGALAGLFTGTHSSK
jgi:hypothetical protein